MCEPSEGDRVDGNVAMLRARLSPSAVGERADKAIARALADEFGPDTGWSRSRVQAAIADGRALLDGAPLADASAKIAVAGVVELRADPPAPTRIAAEPVPFDVVFEDAHLLVVDKPAGVATHPAPGTPNGTLVNGLLQHCGPGLFAIGGSDRPGVVHRLDKDTSGLLVVAKTDAALHALQRQFAERAVERRYRAIVWGAPDRGDPRLAGHPATSFDADGMRIAAAIGRHPTDRKRMAVRPAGATGARPAATRIAVEERFGPVETPIASRIACRLETGRTHQIRVHLAHVGHPLIGDPVYGRARRAPGGGAGAAAIEGFSRQALHAETLAFEHPATGARLAFEAQPPADLRDLEAALHAL